MSFSRRMLHMDPCPWTAPKQARDATGYCCRPHAVLQQADTPRALGDLGLWPFHARPRGDSRGATGL
jgi:hypothetical protein